MKILLIKLSSLGDILHSTAIINSLSKINNVELDIIIDTKYASIISSVKKIKNIYLFDEQLTSVYLKKIRIMQLVKYMHTLISKIRQTVYDIVFDLQGIEKSLIFYYFSRGNKKYCKWSLPYKTLVQNKTEHAIDAMYFVVKKAFPDISYSPMIDLGSTSDYSIKYQSCINVLGISERQASEMILLSPFTRWFTKDWPLLYYFIIIVYLVEKGYTPLLIGSSQDLRIYSDFCKIIEKAINCIFAAFSDNKNCHAIEELNFDKFINHTGYGVNNKYFRKKFNKINQVHEKGCKVGNMTNDALLDVYLTYYYSSWTVANKCKETIIRLWGDRINTIKKLYELYAFYLKSHRIINAIGMLNPDDIPVLMKKSKLFIGSDSFNFHVSQSTSTKSVVFFGPTSIKRVGPLNKNISDVFVKKELNCLECYKKTCPKKLNAFRACMYDLNPFDVIYYLDTV